jgi:uridylate kinase
MTNAPIVISLGGSLIVPATGIDTAFLKAFHDLLLAQIEKGQRFIVIGGGGSTARAYMNAAQALVSLEPEDMDWLGIHSCRLNGHLLRTIFRSVAHPVMVKDPRRKKACHEPILIGTGWKPGWSSDYCAVRFARTYGAQYIINLSNIEKVYSKDPKKHADAVPYDHMTWKQLQAIVGDVWVPGSSAPFDPIATKWASRWKMKVVVARGSDIENTRAILNHEPFIGTTIH